MRIIFFVIVLLPLCAVSLYAKRPSSSSKQEVRPMAVAGSFYPVDPAELGKMLDQLLAAAKVPAVPDLVAIVAPHAVLWPGGGVFVCPATRPEGAAGGGDRSLSLRGLRLFLGL